MKKLFLLVFIFLSLKGFSQYPVLQTQGSDSSLLTSKGAFKSRLINFPFTDTMQANTNRIKFYDGAQIYTKSGGAKFWIRDSTLNKWIQFQAGVSTAFVDSITLSSSQTTDTLKYWKAGTGTTVGYIDRPDGLIQGGIVTWSGVGLIYDITSAIYWIANVRYTSAAQSVTLAAADPTDPTIYTFYLDNTGTFGAIRGTPDPDPVETLPDAATQLYRGFVLVDAGATTPTNLPNIIYDENLGPTSEWTGQSVGGTTNFGGVTNPFNGTKTTDIGAFTTGKTVTYVDFTSFQTTSYNTLKMYIRLKAAFANNTNINLQFLNGATIVSNSVVLAATHGFVKSTVGSYQNISVLLSAFTFTSNTVDRLRITFTGSNASGLYIDYVQLQQGTNNSGGGPWEPVITPANLTGRYWNGYKQFVRLNSDSVLEGSTNLFFTGPRAVSALSGQNISIFNNNSLYQTSTNLHDSLVIVNARIDSLAAIEDTTWVGTGVGVGVPIFVTHNIALDRDSILIDTTTSVTGLATKAFVLNNGASGKVNISDTAAMLSPYLRSNIAAATYQPIGTYVTAVTGTSPIASSGGTTPVISLNNTAVTPGSYTATNLTVDAQGRITSAANGSAGSSSVGTFDSTLYGSRKATIGSGTTINHFGDSYTTGLKSTGQGRYTTTLDSALVGIEANYGVTSTGVFATAGTVFSSLPTSGNYNPSTFLIGLNDARWGGSVAGNLEKVKCGIRSMLANQFLRTAIPASVMTQAGTWTALASGTYKDKASLSLGGTGMKSSVSGSTLTATFYGASLVIGCFGSDSSIYADGKFQVSVDGRILETYYPNGKALYVATRDSARMPNARIYLGLGGNSHTLVITTTENKPTLIDYIGTLFPEGQAAPALVGSVPYVQAVGYALINPPLTKNSTMDSVSTAIKSAVNEFQNYPVVYVNVNKYRDTTIDMDVDGLHPNNIGYGNIARAFQEQIIKNLPWVVRPSENLSISSTASLKVSTGLYNIGIGNLALDVNTTGIGNLGIGYGALSKTTTGNGSVALGREVLFNATSATGQNTGVGSTALKTLTNANGNTAVGFGALLLDVTGSENTAIGVNALGKTTVAGNTAVGANASLNSTTGTPQVTVGYDAGYTGTAAHDMVAVGPYACFNCTGIRNVAIGSSSLYSSTTGAFSNTAIGYLSGNANTSGSQNVFLGNYAGAYNTTVADQIFIDNRSRTNYAGDQAGAPFYWQTNATIASQIGRLNGNVGINKAATSTLDVSGSFSAGYVAKTGTYTATITDYTINCTSGTFTVTLPTAVGIAGRVYVITNSGAGTITIGTTSSQTFANVVATPTTVVMAAVGARTVQSDGANWLLLTSL